ncbi:MAG: alpha-hydroxy acid oxidase [Acidimicrobiales bacterium]|nr:alpha-hydroxy acid oxidase [Acidimicrobiales bacterium]
MGIRRQSDLKLVLKGIQRVDDAERAAAMGVDAIALSNHGGRQLDGAPSAIELVGAIADVVGDDVDIICDGGVRRGSDIVKACAAGADAVMLGRPYLYRLAAGGETGVDWMLDHLVTGLKRTMALCGRSSIEELDRGLLGGSARLADDRRR